MATKQIARVCADDNMHTCIEVSRENGQVKFIPMTTSGFDLEQMRINDFDKMYTEMQDYPVDKAAKLYAGYAADTGGSPAAMHSLALLTPLTKGEIDMATAKKTVVAKAPAKSAAKPATKKAAPVEKAAVAKREPKVAKEPKAPAEKKPSAANMFKELIMLGTMKDEAIFKKVQKAFDLSDDKFSYVKWYRNDLAKKGMNPPEAK